MSNQTRSPLLIIADKVLHLNMDRRDPEQWHIENLRLLQPYVASTVNSQKMLPESIHINLHQ
jgi:hypothetical protein